MHSTSLRSEEHTSELQSHSDIVCRLLLEKKNQLPQVNIQQVITTQTPTEGLFRAGLVQCYYRVEPIIAWEGTAAMLVLEDFPFFTRVLRERIVVALGATVVLLAFLFFFIATATPDIYTLSLHDALPI